MKTIKLKLLTQNQLQPITTNASTFAEFKADEQVKALGIDWSSHKLIDRATRATFELDEAKMPEVDSIMFVTPTKTKSGMLSYKEAKEEIQKLISEGKIEKISWVGKSTKDLNDLLQKSFTEKTGKLVTEKVAQELNEKDTIVEEIQELLTKVSNKVNELSKLSGNDTSVLAKELKEFKENLADFVTNDDLTKELKDIQSRLK
jgi:hypothetical protein